MLTADAVSRFGTRMALAQALGISPSNITAWHDVVPLSWAAILALSDKRLKVDLELYDKLPPCLEGRK